MDKNNFILELDNLIIDVVNIRKEDNDFSNTIIKLLDFLDKYIQYFNINENDIYQKYFREYEKWNISNIDLEKCYFYIIYIIARERFGEGFIRFKIIDKTLENVLNRIKTIYLFKT